jgi:hypothetical protein
VTRRMWIPFAFALTLVVLSGTVLWADVYLPLQRTPQYCTPNNDSHGDAFVLTGAWSDINATPCNAYAYPSWSYKATYGNAISCDGCSSLGNGNLCVNSADLYEWWLDCLAQNVTVSDSCTHIDEVTVELWHREFVN